MDFVRPMLNTPVEQQTEIAYELIDTVTARVESGRHYNRMLMGRAYYHDGFRLYSPQDWMTLLRIWETLQARMDGDPPAVMETAPK
jgi:hypothetical protein